jgi:hypothetical protein
MMQETLSEFGLHNGQHEIQYTEWRMNQYACNMCNFTYVCFYTWYAIKNVWITVGKIYLKNSVHNVGYGVASFST